MSKEYERFATPRPVWVRHSANDWLPGHSLARLRWPGRNWDEYEVAYATDSGETRHVNVLNHRVCTRRPMAQPEKDAPCARCGTSREVCDRREQAEWPPYCCPRCRRSKEKYALHVRPGPAG